MIRKTAMTLAALSFASAAAFAETDVPFALDWKFEGPSAPYFHALDAGYFADADLNVSISEGAGSLDAICLLYTSPSPRD